ncbi:hypothetical protein QFC19_009025 [Naganishia cerealis]|uniref:Uncharacterized protein n=1 Tax=Naganishia cerealis TaxID=610337 RepID=A0ACC2UWW0_9TREE|nr:hypothetical protein QFC19_009025 [Naganishia cerealis]
MSHTTSLLACLSRPGPSRLAKRLVPCQACVEHIRHASSTSAEAANDVDPEADIAASTVSDSAQSSPTIRGQGYDSWLQSVGRQYKDAPTNGPNWLGGHVPYPTNPTFRPPPPLSDTLKEMIYQEYFFPDKVSSSVPVSPLAAPSSAKGANKTGSIAQISARHGISKARIEAVLRLKMVEKEWQKTNKVLQIPFQTRMEQYLGVKSPRPGKDLTKRNWNAEKQEKDARLAHPSSSLEQAEESAVDPETQEPLPTSAFSRRDTIKELDGVERNVWEFRGMEDADPATTSTGGPAALDVPYNRTTSTKSSTEKTSATAPQKKEITSSGERVSVGKKQHAYRFVDAPSTSVSTRGMGKRQYRDVQKNK